MHQIGSLWREQDFFSLSLSLSEWENWSIWGKKQLVGCWENPTDINLHEGFTAIKAHGNKTPTKSKAKRELHKHTYTLTHIYMCIHTCTYTHYYSPVVGYSEGIRRAGKTKTKHLHKRILFPITDSVNDTKDMESCLTDKLGSRKPGGMNERL